MVNAHSRRVNSRRVGGAVHRECLIWRAKGVEGQVGRDPGRAVVLVRPPSSSTARGVLGADEDEMDGEWSLRDRCRPSANAEDSVYFHLTLSGETMQVVSPTSFEPFLGFSCR